MSTGGLQAEKRCDMEMKKHDDVATIIVLKPRG